MQRLDRDLAAGDELLHEQRRAAPDVVGPLRCRARGLRIVGPDHPLAPGQARRLDHAGEADVGEMVAVDDLGPARLGHLAGVEGAPQRALVAGAGRRVGGVVGEAEDARRSGPRATTPTSSTATTASTGPRPSRSASIAAARSGSSKGSSIARVPAGSSAGETWSDATTTSTPSALAAATNVGGPVRGGRGGGGRRARPYHGRYDRSRGADPHPHRCREGQDPRGPGGRGRRRDAGAVGRGHRRVGRGLHLRHVVPRARRRRRDRGRPAPRRPADRDRRRQRRSARRRHARLHRGRHGDAEPQQAGAQGGGADVPRPTSRARWRRP